MSKAVSNIEITKVATDNGIVLTAKELAKVSKLVETTIPTYTNGEKMEIIVTDAIFEICKVAQHHMEDEY